MSEKKINPNFDPKEVSVEVHLHRVATELASIRAMMAEVIKYMKDAESEIPEFMRRFIMYMHDIHDVKHLYEEHGLSVPSHVARECERCDDRLRQLLTDLHADGGTFEKVRRKMAEDPLNRWDHTRQLAAPKKESAA